MALQSTTAIATITVQQASSTVTFSGIPDTYRDLVVVANMKVTASADARLLFNGDTSTSYSMTQMAGTANGVLGNAGTTAFGYLNPNYNISTTDFDSYTAQILDYSVTDKHKTYLSRYSLAATNTNAIASRWAKTEAINTITFYTTANAWAAGTTFSLFGRIA